MAEDKGFQPTGRRLEQARKEGQVTKSRILSSSCASAAILIGLWGALSASWVSWPILLNYCFSEAPTAALVCARRFVSSGTTVLFRGLVAGAVTALLVEMLQVGIRLDWGVLGFRLERLDPVSGFGRLGAALVRSWRALVALLIIGAVVSSVIAWFVSGALASSAGIGSSDTAVVSAWGLSSVRLMCALAAIALLALGVGEYLLNRREHFRKLSMSADEVRREHREEEGDPLLKGTRRALHEALVLQDMERRVKRSRFIVVERNSPLKADSS